ncbi:cation efflux protein, CzcI family [Cupriavidus sp. AU9028]|uniref:cation efflux protein, CzcI family n=1 Tax=Cupriavidus sp. AU9028 TaxID=2871157 RepID=UPI001C982BAE|nr:cation efflux protein, CzcI family [Cupriavidus sp. AU9028]MBY4895890.1 cobalt-zinc-cadmium resistance protein [Cupriavidus sp. AU9028]
MRRLFLIVLMLILPLQFAWAGAAAYCQHEGRGASHFGHHEHEHHAGQAGAQRQDAGARHDKHAKQDDQKKQLLVDPDCGTCHTASVPFALAQNPGTIAMLPAGLPAAMATPSPRSPWARAPDRPQWHSLA